MSLRLFESLTTTVALSDVFSDATLLDAMARFEVALARAEARAGLIPSRAADAIATAAATALDPAPIGRGARASGTIAIPFLEAFTARVRAVDADAVTYVHRGATSQDVVDTALVLCLGQARAILEVDHKRLVTAVRLLAKRHAGTVMLARTLLQPAPPITFGLKAAGWQAAAARCHARLGSAFTEASLLQFGGASGTLAAFGDLGLALAADVAKELRLQLPDAPWHTHRDRLASLVAACGIYTATLGKMARDITLLMQHEVAEASERGGGSSTLPHKRNPARCAAALAAAARVPGLVATYLTSMPQEHERGVGNWHAEATTIADVVQATGAALEAMADVAESLSVDAARMRQNIASTNGFIFAERAMLLLSDRLGRDAAGPLVAEAMAAARRDQSNFVEVLVSSPETAAALSPAVRASLGDPEAYLGSAERFRKRLLGEMED